MAGDTPADAFDPAQTSVHIGRAAAGEVASAGWLVSRFSPFLEMQAGYRLKGPLERLHDPADIVQDVWGSVLPHLGELQPRDGRWTPVLMKYLATTLLRRINTLLRDEVRGKPRREEVRTGAEGRDSVFAATLTGAFTQAARDEARARIAGCLEQLAPKAREAIVLRGIEQIPNDVVADRLGESKSTITMRYTRALEALRACLPHSIFDEI
jgi:RNA polymerase sigma factor (sigma-70 family)